MTPERWRRVEELFHDAAERPPDQRAAFLAAACSGDAALRQEVETLLRQQDGTLLRGGIAEAAARIARSPRIDHEGRTLGDYVLGPLLGAGGMGDVYRARDMKLGRDVAVKILPDALGHDPERLARFEREARILASLNHPHIGAIYGLAEADGLVGLVLELVDGRTLADRLHGEGTRAETGAIPLEEALGIARQIADALHAAHRKGVVHRDLKPANIKVRADGAVKVLDFGLAKVDTPDASDPAALPVLATREGVVLGTVAYMSPEQARGLAVDKRTDIWAFGCVLYEMLTGLRPFPGDSAADVLGGITGAEPDWAALPQETPRRIRDLLRRCLAKDPDRRLHDMADARIEIDDAGSDDSVADPVGAAAERRRSVIPWALSAALAMTAAAAIWFAAGGRAPATPMRLAIPLPDHLSVWGIGRGSSLAVAPDGQRIVYAGIADGKRQLYMRPLDGPEVPIAGTEGAVNPFFSPDGRWIGFMDEAEGGSLKKVPVTGGPAQTIVDSMQGGTNAFAVQAAEWSPDDTIVFAAMNPRKRGVWRVPAGGGEPVRLTTPRPGEYLHAWPHMLSDHNAVLYTAWNNTGFDGGRIFVQSLAGGEPVLLVTSGSYGRVLTQNGRAWLVYAKAEGLQAVALDLDRLRLAGDATPVVDGVQVNLSGGAHFSISQGGLLAYLPGGLNEGRDRTALWLSRDGVETEIGVIPGLGFQYRISPDGRRLVRPYAAGARDLLVDNLEQRGTPRRLTFGSSVNFPVWNHDGSRIIYVSGASPRNLFWIAADGRGAEERLTTSPHDQLPGSVSRNGVLAYVEDHPDRGGDIWVMSLRQPRQPKLLVGTPSADIGPAISPDGRWVAYESLTSGQFEIYLASLEDGRHHLPISNGPGFAPVWSPDGSEIYYRDRRPAAADGHMMAVAIDTTGPEPKIGMPRALFPNRYQGAGDIAPDGRFLLLKRTPWESPSRVIHLVFNWVADLEAKALRR